MKRHCHDDKRSCAPRGILLIVATLTSCDVDELVKNAINNSQSETLYEAPDGMALGDNNYLFDSNGQALTDPSGNKVQVIHDTGGNLVKGRFNRYLVNQRDVYENRLSNELLVNSRGEVWLDGNNNLVLAKRIPGSGSYDDATPNPVEEATTLTGLIKHPPSPPPVFFGAASGHYYRNQRHNLLAATNANNYLMLGGYPDHFYNGNTPLEKLDLNNNTLTLATNGYGIVTLDECHFNSVMIDSLFSTPPSLSDIVNSQELGCRPNNARQMAFNVYILPTELTRRLWLEK